MAMFKKGVSFDNQVVVDVLQGEKCQNCDSPLNLLSSSNGFVPCEKCGHRNEIQELSEEGETTDERV